MTQKIEIFAQNFAHFGGFEGSFLTILGSKTHFLGLFVLLKFKGKLLRLFATHNLRSPLGSRKALQNRFAEQTGYRLGDSPLVV